MLFIVFIALLILVLAIFSGFTAKQNGESLRVYVLIGLISGVVLIGATIKLPYWHQHPEVRAEATAKSSASIQSTKTTKMVFNEDEQRKQAAKTKLKVANTLKQVRANYHDLGEVTASQSAQTFTVKPTNAKYMQALTAMQRDPQNNQKNIAKVIANYQALSQSIKKNAVAGYTVQLLQPHTKQVLLAIKDGKITVNKLKA